MFDSDVVDEVYHQTPETRPLVDPSVIVDRVTTAGAVVKRVDVAHESGPTGPKYRPQENHVWTTPLKHSAHVVKDSCYVQMQIVYAPQEVHQSIHEVHKFIGLGRSGLSEVVESIHIGAKQTNAAHIEPGHHCMRRPVVFDMLVKPSVEQPLEGPESNENTERAAKGEHCVEEEDQRGARELQWVNHLACLQ